jgi:hypothetical protein
MTVQTDLWAERKCPVLTEEKIMKGQITYKFKQSTLQLWSNMFSNSITMQLSKDDSPESYGRFIAEAGLKKFAKALVDHSVPFSELPEKAEINIEFFDNGNCYISKYSSDNVFTLSTEELVKGDLSLIESIEQVASERRAKFQKEEEEEAADAARQEKEDNDLICTNRSKAAKLLEGAHFQRIDDDGNIVMAKGSTIFVIGSTHKVWDYGDSSDDSVIVTVEGQTLLLS